MENKDERKEIAEGLGAATAGSYVAERRRQRSGRKRAKKPSGLAELPGAAIRSCTSHVHPSPSMAVGGGPAHGER